MTKPNPFEHFGMTELDTISAALKCYRETNILVAYEYRHIASMLIDIAKQGEEIEQEWREKSTMCGVRQERNSGEE